MVAKTQTHPLSAPPGVNIENLLWHYRALLEAHGIKHPIPEVRKEHQKLTHPIPASLYQMQKEFNEFNCTLDEWKAVYGDVEVLDVKVIGVKVMVKVSLGK